MKIITQRLVIRPLAVEDRQSMQRILTDFENSDVYMYDYKAPTDIETIRTLIPFWVKSRRYYTVCIQATGETAGFLSMDGDELGFTMKTSCKRKGYGYEAASALIEYLNRKKKMYCFTAQAASENTASVRLLRKLGFRAETVVDVKFRENLPAVECINFVLNI